MSISQRTFRAAVYAMTDGGSGGVVTSTYTRANSTDADRLWWCSRSVPTGREVAVGMRPEHRIDAVFGFAAAVTLTNDGLLVCDGSQYLIRAILDRDYGRDEVQVLAEKSLDTFSLVNP